MGEEEHQETTLLLRPQETKKTTSLEFFKTIAPIMFLQASVGLCASLQATFYPIEAELKGARASQFGAVFGIIHLSLFIFGPIVGKYLSVFGVRVIYPAGFLVDGASFIFFGLLQWVDNTTMFLVLSYVIRFLEGVGAAATWTSNLSILMAKFPDRKGSIKAWCDASFNFGLTVGPVVGAVLYEAGGFCLPFAVTGTAIILSGLATYAVTDLPCLEKTEKTSSVIRFLSSLEICGALLTATMAAYTIGTIEATLSPFLETLPSMTVQLIALTFLTMSVSSVLATPVSGWLCDRIPGSPWLVSCLGVSLMFLCFTTLGPAPYLPSLSPTMTTVSCSLVTQGVGSAAVLVASFTCAQAAAVGAGLGDNMETQSVVSGLFTSAFAAGNFCGPTLSGILYDLVGFAYNSVVIQCLLMLVFSLNLLFYLTNTNKRAGDIPREI